jgi:hypothetical protein
MVKLLQYGFRSKFALRDGDLKKIYNIFWCVDSGMKDVLSSGARIVNLSSHLGHLSMINGDEK